MSNAKISCLPCNITFANKPNFLRHQRKFHAQEKQVICSQICGVCRDKFRTMFDLHDHIEKKHSEINLVFLEKVFYCEDDFNNWKRETEEKTSSYYTLHHSKNYEDSVILQFRCNRSGRPILKEKSERMRHMKIKGTIKSGVTCPSMLKVTKQFHNEATQIFVSYQSTHVGHQCDKNKLPLQKEDRAKIAGILEAGIPPTVVLDKIQEYSPEKT